eukprot:124676-Rhodomonas_salina.6
MGFMICVRFASKNTSLKNPLNPTWSWGNAFVSARAYRAKSKTIRCLLGTVCTKDADYNI